jgi:hypothetical protein
MVSAVAGKGRCGVGSHGVVDHTEWGAESSREMLPPRWGG